MNRSLLTLLTLLLLFPSWAKDRDRNANTTPALTEKAISAGFNHTLIIQEGLVFAWGENVYGQLGDGTMTPTGLGVPVAGLDHIIAVSAGRRHSLALRADGKVFAWGDNTYSQLGTVGIGSPSPVMVPGVTDIIDIQAGDFHSLALKSDGTVISWGTNALGELGRGFTSPSETPGNVVDVSGTGNLEGITLISAGARHSMAIKNGNVLAWGDNFNTQIGKSSSTFSSPTPDFIMKGLFFPIRLTDIIALSAGETHSMATDVAGNLWTWGEGVYGQLGIGGPIDPLNPATFRRRRASVVASQVRTMAAGYTHSTYIDSKGELHFFGANFHGQLGIPLTTTRIESPGTAGYNKSVALACGADFTVILKSDGSIVGAGDNAHEQIGPLVTPSVPVFTSFFNKVDRLAQVANQQNSFVLKSDGTVWAFGHKDYVGFAATSHVATPTLIPGLKDIIALGGTNQNAFALTVDGQVYAWGENDSGVCGQGTTTSLYGSPTLITGLSDIVYVDGTLQGYTSGNGGSSACAIDVNGDLYSWGNNRKYTLGDGTNTTRLTPVRASLTSKDFSASMSKGNTFVLKANNSIWVWGNTSNDGAIGSSYTPARSINSAAKFKSISTTREIRMALRVDGKIELWGDSGSQSPNFFKICQGSSPYYLIDYPSLAYENPTSSVLIENVKFIETGDPQGFFIKADGSTWSWGANNYGQLGHGYKSTEVITPLQVSCSVPGYGVSMYTAISSEHHALANISSRLIQSWGPNTEGQVGNGTISPSASLPVLLCNAALRVTPESEPVIDAQALIYPNPVKETLHIKLPSELAEEELELRLIDTTGKIVLAQPVASSNIDLRVSQLKNGIYILKLGPIQRRILIRP